MNNKKSMIFAHASDCHIGGWKEERLQKLNMWSFRKLIEHCMERNVEFLLISGDLFNTALPPIELIKEVTLLLKKLKDAGIRVYCIPGSHDFSPSGKTMLDVLENAGLVVNVMKFEEENGKVKLRFTTDEKTGAKMTGIFGKKGGLEKNYYVILEKEHLEKEQGFKIFLFHTGIYEFLPPELREMDSVGFESLPKNFNYYAGGHIHYVKQVRTKNGLLAFPGALFPNNFAELEKYGHGNFYIISYENKKLEHELVPLIAKEKMNFTFSVEKKEPETIKKEIMRTLKESQIKDKIVTLRIEGALERGKLSDLDMTEFFDSLDAYCILKNTSKVLIKELENIGVQKGEIHDVEKGIIKKTAKENLFAGISVEKTEKLVEHLIESFNTEKFEGEKNMDFEARVMKDTEKVLGIEHVH